MHKLDLKLIESSQLKRVIQSPQSNVFTQDETFASDNQNFLKRMLSTTKSSHEEQRRISEKKMSILQSEVKRLQEVTRKKFDQDGEVI